MSIGLSYMQWLYYHIIQFLSLIDTRYLKNGPANFISWLHTISSIVITSFHYFYHSPSLLPIFVNTYHQPIIPIFTPTCFVVSLNTLPDCILQSPVSFLNLWIYLNLTRSDNINNIFQHMKGINLANHPEKARVVTHYITALSQGIKDWKICLAGKLFAPGIMLWKNAEKAAKFIWPHLKRDN